MKVTNQEALLTTAEAAARIGMSRAFLERDRWEAKRNGGKGPRIPFVHVSDRAIRYRAEDVEAFIEANTSNAR